MLDYPRLETANKLGAFVDYRVQGKVYEKIRFKDPVDPNKTPKSNSYNTKTKKLLAYLDYIDVLQGKIAGIAEQELRYKTYYDPATYTTGTGVVVDRLNTWGTEQVGQLWWDLTNAKFLNPYQNDVTYSTNNWNKLYSGASIDVYEWIETTLTPTEWNAQADTNDGLSQGISGLQKALKTMSQKVYDSLSQSFKTNIFIG